MTSQIRRISVDWIGPLMVAIVGVAVVLLNHESPLTAVVLVGAFLAFIALHLVRRDALPVLALWAFITLPLAFSSLGGPLSFYFTPAVLILFVWSYRTLVFGGRRVSLPRGYVAAFFTGLLVLCVGALLGVSPIQSFAWLFVYLVVFGLSPMAASVDGAVNIRALEKSILLAGILVGVVAMAEFLFGVNPWNMMYSQSSQNRVWSVFRAKSSLGHPLQVSLVASSIFGMAIFYFQRYRLLATCALVATTTTVVLTASLTGVIAMISAAGAGIAVVLFSRGRRRIGGAVISSLIGALLLSFVLSGSLLEDRNESGGQGSWNYRAQLFELIVPLFQRAPILGGGAGTSSQVFSALGVGLPLENSALQLLVSTGVSGVTVLLSIVWAAVRAARSGRPEVVAGIVAVVVSLVGFNGLDATPGVLAFLGAMIVLAWSPPYGSNQLAAPSQARSRHSTREVVSR